MAVASWISRSRTLRSGRFDRGRKDNDEDAVKIDLSKDVRYNCQKLLEGMCSGAEISESKRLGYLNWFVKLLVSTKGDLSSSGFDTQDILYCMRVCLLHQSTTVRAGCLRAARHMLRAECDVVAMNRALYPALVARSLDLTLRNDTERVQALKLMRKALLLSPEHFHPALARSLVSFANGVTEEKDRMLRACLAALCELALLNPPLFIRHGGVAAVTRNILECQMPRIVECLCGVLLHLLHSPETRTAARVDLQCLAAPYCDFHYRHAWNDKNRNERELRFNCARLALLSVLRSWPGVLHFCGPSGTGGLQAIVQVLYLDQLEVRKAVLDLLYELLGLPQPDWTDEYSVALNAVDPSDPQDCWRLGEGFVAAEGRCIVPHLARHTPNMADVHLAVLLYVFLEAGLLGALVELVVGTDTFISVRATVLLGELLHLMHVLLPPECCDLSPQLPGLVTARARPGGEHNALAAVTALHQLHALLKRRPASASLYLDHVLRAGRRFSCTPTGERTTDACSPLASAIATAAPRHRASNTFNVTRATRFVARVAFGSDPPSEPGVGNTCEAALRESGVLHSKEGFHTWNWDVIGAILRRDGDRALRLDDSNHRLFLRRLVHYYQPSSNRYSHLDLASGSASDQRQSRVRTSVGCELVQRLLAMSDQPEATKLLSEWFADIAAHVDAISAGKSAHDCLFSPQHMANTLCQTYFLFVGYMCHEITGIRLLTEIGMFEKLTALATDTNHPCYVKLIVSSFDYARDGPPRLILKGVLSAARQESSRLYATQFLLVLLRAGVPRFETWGLELIVRQLTDGSRAVALTALNIALEACERRDCLEALVELRPNADHLGLKGLLLRTRLLSVPRGFRAYGGQRNATAEIERWVGGLSYKYVHFVEAELLDSLTLHQRSEDGRYDRRHGSSTVTGGGRWQGARRDVFVPPHLYGQLAQHEQGWAVLDESACLEPLVALLNEAAAAPPHWWRPCSDTRLLELKAAMWACGHAAASALGCRRLVQHGVFKYVISIAESCPVYSLRGTAVYVLGLMATTSAGANELFSLGWACVRHDRHERWPVVEEEDWTTITPDSEEEVGTTISSSENTSDWAALDAWVDDVEESVITTGRSSTLPTSQVQQDAATLHKRSLSESHRNRDSSISSCESAPPNVGGQVNRPQASNGAGSCRLSPIPSSSSLSTLRTGAAGCWTADGPRRVSLSAHSCSNSTGLAISPPDASRLSHQDLLGYNTLRTLRRMRASSFRSEQQRTRYENSLFVEGALHAISVGERKPRRLRPSDAGPCYMGVCLPRRLASLFPARESQADVPSVEEPVIGDTRHIRSACLRCAAGGETSPTRVDQVRADIMKHVERLANPVSNKQSRQALLQLKQRHPTAFKDVCLYSEVCSAMAATMYRVGTRRFLHELFLDLNFEEQLSECTAALRKRLFHDELEQTVNLHITKPAIKLDSLKLTCSENKFPITQRNHTVSNMRSSLRSPDSPHKHFPPSDFSGRFARGSEVLTAEET